MSTGEDFIKYIVLANKAVCDSRKTNFIGCQIPVPSGLNFDYLEKELPDYKDCDILMLLCYGCPIIYKGLGCLSRVYHNHKGATDFPDHIDHFLRKEVEATSVMGPFRSSAFDIKTTVSPLNTVPKKESTDCRVIVDLSFPKHNPRELVNGGISWDCFLGDPIHLRYPSVDNLVNLVRRKGPGCCLFKCDLSHAYRQLPVDPGDLHHLGYRWRGDLFIDVILTMGLRSAAFLRQRVTNAITYIAKNNEVSISNYLNDFAGVEIKDSATKAFLKLRDILKQNGLVISPAKTCWPNVHMVFLGIMVDTEQMVLEVSPDRLRAAAGLDGEGFSHQETDAKPGACPAVCGHLCQARPNLHGQAVEFSPQLPELGECPMLDDLRADLEWWLTFLLHYNGVWVIPEIDWSDLDAMLLVMPVSLWQGGGFRAIISTPHSRHSFKRWGCTLMDWKC